MGSDAMSLFDDDHPQKPKETRIIVGEDLGSHSESDLADRIAELENEISRTRDALKSRSNIRDAAESLFGKKPT